MIVGFDVDIFGCSADNVDGAVDGIFRTNYQATKFNFLTSLNILRPIACMNSIDDTNGICVVKCRSSGCENQPS